MMDEIEEYLQQNATVHPKSIFKNFKFIFKGLTDKEEEHYHRIVDLFGGNFPRAIEEYTLVFAKDFNKYSTETGTTFYDMSFIADCITSERTLDIADYRLGPQETSCYMGRHVLRGQDCLRYFANKLHAKTITQNIKQDSSELRSDRWSPEKGASVTSNKEIIDRNQEDTSPESKSDHSQKSSESLAKKQVNQTTDPMSGLLVEKAIPCSVSMEITAPESPDEGSVVTSKKEKKKNFKRNKVHSKTPTAHMNGYQRKKSPIINLRNRMCNKAGTSGLNKRTETKDESSDCFIVSDDDNAVSKSLRSKEKKIVKRPTKKIRTAYFESSDSSSDTKISLSDTEIPKKTRNKLPNKTDGSTTEELNYSSLEEDSLSQTNLRRERKNFKNESPVSASVPNPKNENRSTPLESSETQNKQYMSFDYCSNEKNKCLIPNCQLARVNHDRHGLPARDFKRYEQELMLKYLVNNNCISLARGNKVWKMMINEGFLRNRTVQSLQNNFRRSILDKIWSFKLPRDIKEQFMSLQS